VTSFKLVASSQPFRENCRLLLQDTNVVRSLYISATHSRQCAFVPFYARICLDITTSPTKPNNYFTFFTPLNKIRAFPSPPPHLLNVSEQPRGCSTHEYAYKSLSLTHTHTHTHSHTRMFEITLLYRYTSAKHAVWDKGK
jgi:hypothetical protein